MNKFPKKARLCTKSQIKNVFGNKKKIVQGSVAIFFCHNQLNYARLGVVAAKKNISLAVQRNRVKRVVRESFRLNRGNIVGIDVIVFPYKGAEKITKKELFLCLEKLWLKLARCVPQ